MRDRAGWDKYLKPFLEKPLLGNLDWSLTLGSVLAILFVVEALTGMVLAMYYNPSPEYAYQSINYIMDDVFMGRILRGIHHWGAGAMVILVVIHLITTFFYGAYKAPREFTWIIGVFLFIVTLGFGFTGYLLPWDQKAYWATVVGTSIAKDVPFIGEFITKVLRGGAEVSALTLTRFYAVHMLILPALLAVGIVVHIYLVRVHDIAGHWTSEKSKEGKTARFYPDQVFNGAIAFILVFAVIVLMSIFVDPPLENVALTPEPDYLPRPDWYFMWLYKLLTFFPGDLEFIGTLVIPVGGMLILFLLPFFNRMKNRSPADRPIAIAVGIAIIVGVVYANLIGMADSQTYGDVVVVPDRQLTQTEMKGTRIWVEKDCSYCHSVLGRGGRRGHGPDLSNVIAKGRTSEWLIASVKDPQSVSKWNIMPKYENTEEELNVMADYMLSLDLKKYGMKIIPREEIVKGSETEK